MYSGSLPFFKLNRLFVAWDAMIAWAVESASGATEDTTSLMVHALVHFFVSLH